MTPPDVRPVAGALAAMVATLLAVGCADQVTTRNDRRLTQAEHDSILAEQTEIPGTVVVAHALDAKARNAQKNAALNAQIDSLTR